MNNEPANNDPRDHATDCHDYAQQSQRRQTARLCVRASNESGCQTYKAVALDIRATEMQHCNDSARQR